jgi:4-hydroxythreonine-4-phosphate dehydrogenase
MGEPAGIGPELALAAWLGRATAGTPAFVVLADADALADLARTLGWSVPVRRLDTPGQAAAVFADALPVLHRPLVTAVSPGRPESANAVVVRDLIAEAVALAQAGSVSGVVTNPINKDVLNAAGFPFPGHTEFLAHLAGPDVQPVMMLACPQLKVVPVTIHIALAQVPQALTTDAIVSAGRITANALRQDFGLARPRLAVAGLNPHAGERGRMGDEDTTVIAPAVERLRSEGLHVTGPWPADTMFHAGARSGYDAALCMYHDQALIPIKTLDFSGGVNVTLGLPFVRTSPDHGTAFDIAGRGCADPGSLLAALRLAAEMAGRRASIESGWGAP